MLHLRKALVLPIAALAATAGALATASPALADSVQIQPKASVLFDGSVNVSVNAICPVGFNVSVGVSLQQQEKSSLTVFGAGGENFTVACTGNVQTVTVNVTSQFSGVTFVNGKAFAQASETSCTPDFQACDQVVSTSAYIHLGR